MDTHFASMIWKIYPQLEPQSLITMARATHPCYSSLEKYFRTIDKRWHYSNLSELESDLSGRFGKRYSVDPN